MRRISFSHTERQLLDGSKTQTRRIGWRDLRIVKPNENGAIMPNDLNDGRDKCGDDRKAQCRLVNVAGVENRQCMVTLSARDYWFGLFLLGIVGFVLGAYFGSFISVFR